MTQRLFMEQEKYLGEAIRESGIPRSEFFITSKVWKTEMGYEDTKREAFARTLDNLGTDYLDQYLIHVRPLPTPDYAEWKQLDVDTWKALEEFYKAGKVRFRFGPKYGRCRTILRIFWNIVSDGHRWWINWNIIPDMRRKQQCSIAKSMRFSYRHGVRLEEAGCLRICCSLN